MPIQEIPFEIDVTTVGSTVTLDVTDPYTIYNITSVGTITATGLTDIVTSGTLLEGHTFVFNYTARVSPASSAAGARIFGSFIPLQYREKDIKVIAYYNGASWDIKFIPDFEQSNLITESQFSVIPTNVISTDMTATATLNVAGEQELMSLTIPADTFTANNQVVKYVFWGTTDGVGANLKKVKVRLDCATGFSQTVYYNFNVEDLSGDWRVEGEVHLSDIVIGEVVRSGALSGKTAAGTNTDVYSPLIKPLGYDVAAIQYVKLFAEELAPSGSQVTVSGGIVCKL